MVLGLQHRFLESPADEGRGQPEPHGPWGTPLISDAFPKPSPASGAHNGPHAHPVLNNGQGVKHLAVQQGHATAADGVRLFYELYVCPRESVATSSEATVPATPSADASCPVPKPADNGAGDAPSSATASPGGSVPLVASSGGGPPTGASLGSTGQGPGGGSAGRAAESGQQSAASIANVDNVLLIMGFAAGRDGWLPLIDHWMCQAGSESLRRRRVCFCVYDNRGIGDSDSPGPRSSYSTEVMARDGLAVMDHLGWPKAHVVGFSLGGMVALKLAAAASHRLLSLTALSVTNGGWQIIPTKWRALKLLAWAAMARTPQQRAHADVHFHFSRDTLHAQVPVPGGASTGGDRHLKGPTAGPTQRVETALINEYVGTSQGGAPQPQAGLMGQLHAVWTHGLTVAEQHRLRELSVPVKVVHGYHDMMAMPEYGERIAKHIRAELVMLNGGHFVVRECAPQVCMHLADSLARTSTQA